MALLLPAERAQFTALIDDILATGDLATISAKQIRKQLAAHLETDLSDKKVALTELIHERFDQASLRDAAPIPTIEKANGYKKDYKVKNERSVTPSATPPSDTPSDDDAPPKKKVKKNTVKKEKEVDDAKLAALLQAQENSRGRATRGGGVKKQTKVRKQKMPKKKSEAKIKADDDSELEIGTDGEVKEKPKKGGFHKLYNLSAPLADLVGEPTLSRPQVVKKLWVHIKANNLQDPADKRQIICDDRMQLVFKQDKVHMFTMNKLLGKQLYPLEE